MPLNNFYKPFLLERKTGGDFGNQYQVLSACYKMFIQPTSGTESYKEGKNGEQVDAIGFCEVPVPINYGDRITQDGVKYIALYATQPTGISGTGHHKEIKLTVFK